MRASSRSRFIELVRTQWAGLLALFLVIAGGTAYAANTIGSSDIIDGQVFSVDVRDDTLNNGGLAAVDLRSDSVRTSEVANNSLSGADIANQSGVDTCTHGTARYGELCVGIANLQRNWYDARSVCAGLELRLPSLGEAESLARNYDVPTVDETESFWTEEAYVPVDNGGLYAFIVADNAVVIPRHTGNGHETICVTTPTN
jgi:hypothetical protein